MCRGYCRDFEVLPPEFLLLQHIESWQALGKKAWYGCLDCLDGDDGMKACRVEHDEDESMPRRA